MKYQLLALATLCTSIGVDAQNTTAGDLEKICMASTESERISCSLVMNVYLDGFIEGVGKGVVDTYKYDPQVLALVKDIKMKDVVPRITRVVEAATCIQRVSASEMADAYVDFVRQNPELRAGHYRKAMTRAIVSKYCGR